MRLFSAQALLGTQILGNVSGERNIDGHDDHQAEHPNDDGSSFEVASALVDAGGHLGKGLDSRFWKMIQSKLINPSPRIPM